VALHFILRRTIKASIMPIKIAAPQYNSSFKERCIFQQHVLEKNAQPFAASIRNFSGFL